MNDNILNYFIKKIIPLFIILTTVSCIIGSPHKSGDVEDELRVKELSERRATVSPEEQQVIDKEIEYIRDGVNIFEAYPYSEKPDNIDLKDESQKDVDNQIDQQLKKPSQQ